MNEEPREIVIDPPARALQVSKLARMGSFPQVEADPEIDESERTTKIVTLVLTATFHGDYLEADEVLGGLEGWIDRGLEDRDDLRGWKIVASGVEEIHGDPNGYDED